MWPNQTRLTLSPVAGEGKQEGPWERGSRQRSSIPVNAFEKKEIYPPKYGKNFSPISLAEEGISVDAMFVSCEEYLK